MSLNNFLSHDRGQKDRKIRPFLRWAGSKRQLIPRLSLYWRPEFQRYIEPFAGSACLFFALQPTRAVLGDINEELIRTYKEVKYRPAELARVLAPLRRSKRTFLQMRRVAPSNLENAERAGRFVYLNRYCFNGLYRTNSAGEFNVPYGADGTGVLPSSSHLLQCSRILRGAQLRCCDFEELLENAQRGDFVYLDPPFKVSQRRVFNEYNSETFQDTDVERLRAALNRLSDRGICFLLSYVDSAEADYLLKGFQVKHVRVRRHIAGFVRRRTTSNELLISNFAPREH